MIKYRALKDREKFVEGDEAIEKGGVEWFLIKDSIGCSLSEMKNWTNARRPISDKKMSFAEFLDWVNGFSGERPQELRLGQYAFILLSESYPNIASQISTTDDDPFYVDQKIPQFLCTILKDFVEPFPKN